MYDITCRFRKGNNLIRNGNNKWKEKLQLISVMKALAIIREFAKETPGTGKNKLSSRYTYYVETLLEGNRIYLKRPAWIHSGFDFLVCVENHTFNKGTITRHAPSQNDILNDLEYKKAEAPIPYEQLVKLLENIYNCHEIDYIPLQLPKFNTGYSADLIIKVVKWLFIEQDIRYWNYSGRAMFWKAIKNI